MLARIIAAMARQATTFNPADKTPGCILSQGDLRAENGSGQPFDGVRCTDARNSGKWYFEATNISGAPGDDMYVGICAGGVALDNFLGVFANSWGYQTDGAVYYSTGAFNTLSIWRTAGDVVAWAVDLDNRKVWAKKIGGNWNGSGAANPATNTAGEDITADIAFFVAATMGPSLSLQVNFGATAFSGSVPSGFQAWGG